MTRRQNFPNSQPNGDFDLTDALELLLHQFSGLENQVSVAKQTLSTVVQLQKDEEMKHREQVGDLKDELSETKSLTCSYSNDGEFIADFLERSQDDE